MLKSIHYIIFFQGYFGIYFQKTLNAQIILKIGFTFIIVLVWVKTTGHWSKGPLVTPCSQLPPANSWPLASNALEKLTAGRPFWCPYRDVKICLYHQAQEHQLQRTKNSTQTSVEYNLIKFLLPSYLWEDLHNFHEVWNELSSHNLTYPLEREKGFKKPH